MQNKFTQPVSMQVTKEQYEKDLREPLLRMGYEEVCFTDLDKLNILITSENGLVSNSNEKSCFICGRYFIDHYNPKLFLAIAAMSNVEYGIYGEWWYCIKDVKMEGSGKVEYNRGKLYMGMDNERIVNNSRYYDHYWRGDYRFIHFRKATLQELITNFTEQKQENIMKEITTEQFEELKNLIAPENKERFNKLMGVEKPIFKKEDFRFGDKVWLRNGDMLFVILEWNTLSGTKEDFGLFNEFGAIEASQYNNALLHKDNKLADIMTIYRPKGNFIPYDLANNCLADYDLIWSRE